MTSEPQALTDPFSVGAVDAAVVAGDALVWVAVAVGVEESLALGATEEAQLTATMEAT